MIGCRDSSFHLANVCSAADLCEEIQLFGFGYHQDAPISVQ